MTKDDVKTSQAIYDKLHMRCSERGREYIKRKYPRYKDKITSYNYCKDYVDIYNLDERILAIFGPKGCHGVNCVTYTLSLDELLMEDEEWSLYLDKKMRKTE